MYRTDTTQSRMKGSSICIYLSRHGADPLLLYKWINRWLNLINHLDSCSTLLSSLLRCLRPRVLTHTPNQTFSDTRLANQNKIHVEVIWVKILKTTFFLTQQLFSEDNHILITNQSLLFFVCLRLNNKFPSNNFAENPRKFPWIFHRKIGENVNSYSEEFLVTHSEEPGLRNFM